MKKKSNLTLFMKQLIRSLKEEEHHCKYYFYVFHNFYWFILLGQR